MTLKSCSIGRGQQAPEGHSSVSSCILVFLVVSCPVQRRFHTVCLHCRASQCTSYSDSNGNAGLQVPNVTVTVSVPQCRIGSVQQQDSTLCMYCTAPLYSFSPGTLSCDSPRPSNANCTGGAYMTPLPPYWASDAHSHSIVTCPNSDACQGDRPQLMACLVSSYTQPASSGLDLVCHQICIAHQLTNQLISHSINQPTNQPVNQPTPLIL